MARTSSGLLGTYPAGEMVDLIRTADELRFHACHLADAPSARDCWSVAAAAAQATTSIRLGFSATHVYLREPTLIAQALATLNELSDGRAEAVVSLGDPEILDAYHLDWRGQRHLARIREALAVMRTYLDEGEVEHAGEFFRYSGVQTAVQPVQEHPPLLVGALGGRDPDALHMGAYCVTAVPDEVAPIATAFAQGNVEEALRRTAPAIGEAFPVAGTPGGVCRTTPLRPRRAGLAHILLDLMDPTVVAAFVGWPPAGSPDSRAQLRLIHDRYSRAWHRQDDQPSNQARMVELDRRSDAQH